MRCVACHVNAIAEHARPAEEPTVSTSCRRQRRERGWAGKRPQATAAMMRPAATAAMMRPAATAAMMRPAATAAMMRPARPRNPCARGLPLERELEELRSMRVPVFYGWLIVAVVFVTMGIGVNARTAFSLLFPPILGEFRWDRGVTAGAFSFGFAVSAILSPLLGSMMDRVGPHAVMELGVALMAAGLLGAPLVTEPWHLYLTLGVLVGGGSVCLGYSGQSLFLPNWFVRRRGLAIGI